MFAFLKVRIENLLSTTAYKKGKLYSDGFAGPFAKTCSHECSMTLESILGLVLFEPTPISTKKNLEGFD